MTATTWSLLPCFFLAAAAGVHGAPLPRPARVVAAAVETPPQLDGDLSDAAWQAAGWVAGFSVLDQPTRAADPPTRFKVVFDRDFLYFAVECAEPEMPALRAECRQRDGRVTDDDCVEFMVDPTGERVEYYHFAVNSIGTQYDAQMRQGGNVRSVAWDCSWRAAVRRERDKWCVEAAIPFVALGLSAKSAGTWAVNVA
ncbi:MAG: carbohydrate-binding family 9-like protein, partial [Armatimonadota bacterium]|nr:carbohydrate-binding family 9-like protein [Armatimonadota bacterium]